MKRKRNNHIDPENDLNNVTIIESPIDLSVQKEYHDLSNSIDFDNVDHEEVSNKADKLFIGNTPIEAKKRILILLAHLGTMESSKILEKYLKISEGSLKDWALLSLKECRMFVDYYVTNVKKPTKLEILKYLREIKREEK